VFDVLLSILVFKRKIQYILLVKKCDKLAAPNNLARNNKELKRKRKLAVNQSEYLGDVLVFLAASKP